MGNARSKTDDSYNRKLNKESSLFETVTTTTTLCINAGRQVPNEREVKLVRESWAEMTRRGDFKTHGNIMMIKFFESQPELKVKWKFAAHLNSREEMFKNAQLRSHGNNVFEAIHATVNSLDKTESLNELLTELGVRHIQYGVKAEYLDVSCLI